MPKRYEGRLAEAARPQSALLTAAATDPRRAWQSVQEILERHRDAISDMCRRQFFMGPMG